MSSSVCSPVERGALDAVEWWSYSYVNLGSDKFWRVRVSGCLMECWWGRRGSAGEKLLKRFSTPGAASAASYERRLEKERKGYLPDGHHGNSGVAVTSRAVAAVSGRSGAGVPSLPPVLRPPRGDAAASVALGRFAALGRRGAFDDDDEDS